MFNKIIVVLLLEQLPAFDLESFVTIAMNPETEDQIKHTNQIIEAFKKAGCNTEDAVKDLKDVELKEIEKEGHIKLSLAEKKILRKASERICTETKEYYL